MIKVLHKSELVAAENGYKNLKCINPHTIQYNEKTGHARIRANDGACNKRFKKFGSLRFDFWHNVELLRAISQEIAEIVAIRLLA